MPGSHWYAHPLFAFLYRWRGVCVSLLCLAASAGLWQGSRDGSWGWSLVPLGAGLALRIWARRHVGLHTRGKGLEAPYRATGGPYRWVSHPLYLSNSLVALGCLGALGTGFLASLLGTIPCAAFYALLALGERAFLAAQAPSPRLGPVAAPGWSKEVWSLAPPLAAWIVLRHIA